MIYKGEEKGLWDFEQDLYITKEDD